MPPAALVTTASSNGGGGGGGRGGGGRGRSLRRDFVLNLETLLQREVITSSTTATSQITITDASIDCTAIFNSLKEKGLPMQPKNDHAGDHLRLINISNSQNCHVQGDNAGASGEMKSGVGRDNGHSGSSGRQALLSSTDRHYIRTYPLRVIDQLRLCYFETKPPTNAPSCFKTMRMYGFECIHCNKTRKSSSIGRKKRGFRKYPKHVNDVVRDLLDFRSHLNVCSNVSSDLVSYLNWMEKWCRFPKMVRSVAIPISHRLDGLRKYGSNDDTALAAAVATSKLLPPLLTSPQKNKRKVGQNSDLALLTKSKRSARRRSHSVLENINSLA